LFSSGDKWFFPGDNSFSFADKSFFSGGKSFIAGEKLAPLEGKPCKFAEKPSKTRFFTLLQ